MCRHGIMHPTLQMQSYYIFFNKRSSNLVYMIKKAALYLPHFLPAHLFFLFISHYARIAPSNRQNICIKIKHLKYKTKFEHLLGIN